VLGRVSTDAPTRLARRLTTFDAVVVGLGSMIGAGIFAAFAPAARAAGNALLVALVLAGAVAYCNAIASARLAAVYPESGGTYVYGRERLGPGWGFVAGFGFVVGKIASCAAMALTFGTYAAPSLARPLAVAAVLALTAVNYFGIQKTALVTRAIVVIVLASLATAVASIWLGGKTELANVWPIGGADVFGILQAAGFLFFAFAGYARIATLGEEVVDPARTIPRAIPIALAIALAVYAAVGVSALAAAGARGLAASSAPIAAAIAASGLEPLAPVVRIGASVACLGVLLSLIAGVSRTAFAMASNGDLPSFFAAVHPRHRVPHRAELAVGILVAAVVAVADVRSAIGFSSFAVLVYYGIANAAAWTLESDRPARHRSIAAMGIVLCGALAIALPLTSVVGGAALFLVGATAYLARQRWIKRDPPADR
jgi:basic amino acid/polyamine antiporter, APA family